MHLRWQEVLISLISTYRGAEELPLLDSKSVASIQNMFFPTDFKVLISALKELSSEILCNSSIKTVKRDDAYPVAGLLALCGWRRLQDQNEHYSLECSSCLRQIDSSLIVPQHLPL